MDLEEDRNEKTSSATLGGQTLETVFEREKEKWRTKMLKVFGDSYPYDFCVAYGHCDEGHSSEGKMDISTKEAKKSEPFERLGEMGDIDKQMEQEFHELWSSMEDKVATSSLNEVLLQRKKECAEVFQQFEEIVGLCEKYFDLEYRDCKNRAEKQADMRTSMLKEVERYLSEVEDAGEKEISLLKDNISSYMREVGTSWSGKIEESYKEMENQHSMMEVWNECAEAITSKDVRDTFIVDQQDTSRLWKKAFDDLLMLSAELKRYRCSYNMTKSNLQRAIYWMNRNYRDNMPKLTKTQGQISRLVDRKSVLSKSLKNTEEDIKKERYEKQNLKLNYYNKIASLHTSNRLAYERTVSRHKKIFEVKKSEIVDLFNTLLKGDREIYVEILDMPWISKDLSFLESEEKNHSATSNKELRPANDVTPKTVKTLHEDDFAEAFRELVCCGNFEILLNHIADELGYMLDFKWVDYAKKTFELKNEIRWLELFKVFKIDFTDDLKDLKKHMMKYCKKEETFDVSSALDRFLQFVKLKRQLNHLDTENSEVQIHQEFWDSVEKAMPKNLLWDSVLELLKKYRVLLQSRQRHLTVRSELVAENEELDNYLKNYKSFDTPSLSN